MATEDERYRSSTQFRLWSFSPSQLADLRAKTNALARQNIADRLSSSSSTTSATASGANTPNPSSSSAAAISTATAPADVPQPPAPTNLPDFLTPADEATILRHVTVQTLRAAEFCELPTEIRATAAIFLRRFFLTHSVMTYPPTKMFKTCIFFGAKAENHYARAAAMAAKFPSTTPDELLAGEFLLCQGLRFAFDVRHPYRALEGAIMQLRAFGDVDEHKIRAAHSRARDILKFSPLVTDAYFHYTPSQIMLAALSMADDSLCQRLLDAAFPPHTQTDSSGANTPASASTNTPIPITGPIVRDRTLATVRACREMLEQEPPERMSQFWGSEEANNLIKPLNKKLKKCRDPDRFDLIALHKKRLEFRETPGSGGGGGGVARGAESAGPMTTTVKGGGGEDAAAAAAADREAKRRKVAAEDPFGPPL